MHIGSAPWNNELVIFHLEDKEYKILALDIGCSFDFGSGFWTSWEGGESGYYFEVGGASLWIPLLIDTDIVSFYLLIEKMCICVYVYIIVNIVLSWIYKAPYTV